MLYGANGYTGRIAAEEAAKRGMHPILAGRTEARIRPIAERLNLPFRCFGIDSAESVASNLDGVDAILLAAGPFSATSEPVVAACLDRKIHYMDITGEIDVFEAVFARDGKARNRGCVLMPGVGFDVVPSDCLANSLKDALPDADTLELAFHSSEGPSAGTTKTVIENLPRGSAVRLAGKLVRKPVAWRTERIPFRDRERTAVSIPWGDIATAYRSTGIPNITVYLAMPEKQIASMRRLGSMSSILGLGVVQALLKSLAGRYVKGPSAESRATARTQLWGRVSTASGWCVEGTLETPESYALTVLTALEIVARIRAGAVEPGSWTPAQAFGGSFITEIDGCDLQIGEPHGV